MASSVLVSIPLEFFRSVVGHSLSDEELGVYMRCYAQAVERRSEYLSRKVPLLELKDTGFNKILDKLKRLGLLGNCDNKKGIRVIGCSENHKSLDFGSVKKLAKESAPIKEIPRPLLNLDQLNTNADLCNRFPELVKSWKLVYPSINLLKELTKANNWLTNNPKVKRPSKTRFLAHWFGKAQIYAERRGSTGGAGTGADSPVSAWEGN